MYINTKIYESIVSKMPGAVGGNGDLNGGADGCNNALSSGVFEKIGIKKQRRIDTDERIFRSAVIEFADKGFGGAKVTDIAKTANISPGLIIQNYGGKEELFMAVTECFVEDLYSALDGKCGDWKYFLGEIANSVRDKLAFDIDTANLTRFFITALNTKSTPQKALDLVTSEFLKTPIPAAMKQGQSDGEIVDGDTVEIYNIFFRTMSNVLAFCSANNTPLPPTDWFLQLLTKQ